MNDLTTDPLPLKSASQVPNRPDPSLKLHRDNMISLSDFIKYLQIRDECVVYET